MVSHKEIRPLCLVIGVMVGLMWLVWSFPAFGQVNLQDAGDTALVYQDFESTDVRKLPNGWRTGGSTSNVPYVTEWPADVPNRPEDSGNKLLHVGRASKSDPRTTGYAYVDFEPLGERAIVSFWFYATNNQRSLNFSMRGKKAGSGETSFSPNNNSSIFLTVNHGRKNIRMFSHRSEDDVVTWMDGPDVYPNTWHHVILDIDVRSSSYTLYLDSYEEPYRIGIPFANESETLTGMAFGYQALSAEDNTSPIYIDEVVVVSCTDQNDSEACSKVSDSVEYRLPEYAGFKAWETWRTHAVRPSGVYDQSLLDQARENYNRLPSVLQDRITSDVRLTMNYDADTINHMIPETTPTATNLTPTPVSDRAFPHGDWRWDPINPDVLVDKTSGRVFPNEEYPEDLVITIDFNGTEQVFSYHRQPDWYHKGYPLGASYSGNIRAQKVNFMAGQVEKIAVIYGLSQDAKYAQQARKILLRFADVYPNYMVHSGFGEFSTVDPIIAAAYIDRLPEPEHTLPHVEPTHSLFDGHWMVGRASGSGMEGTFLLNVATAYDLVADAVDQDGTPLFTEEEKMHIEKNLLLEGAGLVLAQERVDNKSFAGRAAAAAIGAAVGDPMLIRWGYEGFELALDELFLSDGATAESPAYGMQVMTRLWKLGEILDGYTDPKGYVDDEGLRFDQLDIYADPRYAAVWQSLYLSLLPDTKYPAVADSYPSTSINATLILLMAARFDRPDYAALSRYMGQAGTPSFLDSLLYTGGASPPGGTNEATRLFPDVFFPEWKLAYIRDSGDTPDSTMVLSLSDWGTHHHRDHLNLFYWKNGKELLSDLGYLRSHPRGHMTVRTVAHNLVVVNKKDQKTGGRSGDIHLFYPFGKWKLVDASSRAYNETSVYRRLVAQMDHGGGDNYLLDVFWIDGGTTHDYVFHGPNTRYKVDDITLTPSQVNLSEYEFKNPVEGQSNEWKITWDLGDQHLQVIALNAGDEQAIVADGWGQRDRASTTDDLPYVLRRRSGNGLKSRYLSIIEGFHTHPRVVRANVLATGGSGGKLDEVVGVVVDAAPYKDYLLNGTQRADFVSETEHGVLQMSGRSGVASMHDSDGLSLLGVVDGTSISLGNYGVELNSADDPLFGHIVSYDDIGFLIDNTDVDLDRLGILLGQNVFVTGENGRTAYPIRGVEQTDEGLRLITYDALGGFPFVGGAEWEIPQLAYYEKVDDERISLYASGPTELWFPKEYIDMTKLAYRTEDGQWEPLKCRGDAESLRISVLVIPNAFRTDIRIK